jgi:DNA helicase-2/ATP-dependent DNA helicase PcrA
VIIKTLQLFRDRPNILKEYQKQFKYVLIDEFQDTNYTQNELSILLAGRQKNINVVGDDDQSVYRFRGAAVSNIIQFRKSFPKTKVVVLTKNYRSTQEILDRSYDLIQHNNPDRLEVVEKIDKKLRSQVAKDGAEIHFIHSDRVENESDAIAKEIIKLITQDKYSYKDFAILVRANNHSEPIMRALGRNGIPFQFLGPGRLFKQPEIVDLISYLKVLYDFTDSVSFYRLLSIDHFGISGRELAELGNYSRKNHLSLFESAEKIGSEKVKNLIEIIDKHFDLVKKESAGQLLYFFLEETGLLQKLLSPESAEAEKRAKNISKLFDKLKSYEADHEDVSVTAVVEWLDLSMELGESPLATDSDWTDVNAVNILTVHSAKGLEFSVVFLVNLVAQRFPSMERREQIPIPESLIKEILPVGDFHLEEERRLFYVGMTRAKERLFLTAADYYGEGKREKKLSPFIYESLGDKAIPNNQSKIKVDQLSFLDYGIKTKPTEALAKVGEALYIDYLSYSQIETFQTCPLHYKLRYIYKVPTPPSASQSFGTSIHATLKEFYETVPTRPTSPKASSDLESLMTKLLEKNWVREGFKSKKQETDFLEKGKLYLSGFLKNGFNPKVKTIALEQPFTIPLGNNLKIGGRLDRIDDIGNDFIEIIDYKTGAKVPSQRDVDKNLQLSFYALAATKIPTAPFGKIPDKVKLSLYYLDEQEKISTTRTAKQLEKAVEEILKIREEIEKSDFKCSNHMFCQSGCEFSLFCKSDN